MVWRWPAGAGGRHMGSIAGGMLAAGLGRRAGRPVRIRKNQRRREDHMGAGHQAGKQESKQAGLQVNRGAGAGVVGTFALHSR